MSAPPPAILLVEDDEDDVFFVERAFRAIGLPALVGVARDGASAIAWLDGADRPRPDGVLLDLKLPRVSGLEVLRWLRAHGELADLRVIVLSSSEEAQDIDAARALGVDAYLVKAVGFEDLVAQVRTVAELWRLPIGRRLG